MKFVYEHHRDFGVVGYAGTLVGESVPFWTIRFGCSLEKAKTIIVETLYMILCCAMKREVHCRKVVVSCLAKTMTDVVCLWRASSGSKDVFRTTSNQPHNDLNNHAPISMASSLQAVAGPRFLLPKISRRSTSVRPNTNSAAALAYTTTCPRLFESRRPIISTFRRQDIYGSCSAKISIRPPSHHGKAAESPPNPFLTAAHRAFSSTTSRARDHHFDTLKFVQRLKDEGFTEEQAVAMMKVLSDVIEERRVYLVSYMGVC